MYKRQPDGFVTLPNVDPIHEVVNLVSAQRAYDANATAVETLKTMAQRALDIRLLVLDRKGAPWSDGAIEIIRQDLVATVAELSAMAGEFHRDYSCFGPVSVVRRLIQVERRCSAIHAGSLARSADPELRRFFSSLTLRDRRVEQLLEQALRSQALRSQAAPVRMASITTRKVAAHLAA